MRRLGSKLLAHRSFDGLLTCVNYVFPLKAMGKTKYTVSAVVAARSSEPQRENAEPMPRVPKASGFLGSPSKRANQRSPDAAAYLCVSQVCSDAMVYKDDKGDCVFPGITSVNQTVFSVTLSHPQAYPQIDFKIVEKFDEMLKSQVSEGSQQPRNWDDLVQKLHIVAITTGTFSPYNLPYKNWQRAFYVAGDAAVCKNFVMELDNCIVYTVDHNDKPKYGQFPLKVQLAANAGFDVAKEDFDYPHVEVIQNVNVWEMAVTPLHVYPPQGVRPLVVHFEAVDADHVAMTFFGDTWRHRHALDSAGLERSKEIAADNSDGKEISQVERAKRLETFYIMTSKTITEVAEAAFVTNLLTVAVENVVIDLRLITTPDADSATEAFVESLKQIPSLFVH